MPKFMSYEVETAVEAIGMAVGAASMCWEHVEKAGIFQSERAKEIVDALVKCLVELDKE